MLIDAFSKVGVFAKRSSSLQYLIAVILGCLCGYFDVAQPAANFICDVFVKIFKCISLPIIAISLIVSLSQQSSDVRLKKIGKSTLFYTITTTLSAAAVACVLYALISPSNVKSASEIVRGELPAGKYLEYIANMMPSNIFSPFIENNVMGTLLIGVIVGTAIRYIPDPESRAANNFFKGVQAIFLVIVGWVVKILPIALFGFIATAAVQLKSGANLKGLGEYLSVVVLANFAQGLIVLPIFLKTRGMRPFVALKAAAPALSIAFFSKSSVGTLPVAMDTAENNLKISREISRFVLPLCTAINMNGCAAFIFTTVVYVMQNHGIEINPPLLIQWIFIAVVAAIGNAGVPMGCFFLSASLLTSMDIPIDLLWLILPFYGIIDMVETALNVWADMCVAQMVNEKFRDYACSK